MTEQTEKPQEQELSAEPPEKNDPQEITPQEDSCDKTGWLEKVMAWIWTIPTAEDRGARNFLRAALRIHIIVFQEFINDKIPLRSSALTFIVVLSMVPVLALGTSILKGLGVGGEMRETAHSFIATLETTARIPMPDLFLPQTSQAPASVEAEEPAVDDVEDMVLEPDSNIWGQTEPVVSPAKPPSKPEPVVQTEAPPAVSFTGHLNKAVDLVFDYVDKTNFAALGAIGILILLFVVFSVLNSIEDTMNAIWQTKQKRSAGRKMMDYLALMLIMPLVLNLGVAAMAILQSKMLLSMLQHWLPWVGPQLLNLLPVLAIVATFTIFYSFLPNTRVSHKAAIIGGIIGGIGWLMIQVLYFKLQIGVVNYNAIYGSFATLPLFLLWIHISWMVFLAGAEVSFAVQVWDRYLWQKHRLTPIERLGLAYDIVSVTANDYHDKSITTKDHLLKALKQPDAYIQEVLDDLTKAGILRFVQDDSQGYVPSGPIAELSPLEIAELILGEETEQLSENNLALEILAAASKTLAKKKITAKNIQL